MRTKVSTTGQIILPAEIRREDDIKPGQEFLIERIDRGEYLLKRKEKPRNRDLVKLLLSCPVKNWFQPFDRTETTDDILAMRNIRNFKKARVKTLNPFD